MSFDNFRVQRYLYCKTVSVFTIWPDMIKQILGSHKLTGGGGGQGIDCPHCPAKKNCVGQKINKLLIDIACSVKMAKY